MTDGVASAKITKQAVEGASGGAAKPLHGTLEMAVSRRGSRVVKGI